jgi:hypothetical protein
MMLAVQFGQRMGAVDASHAVSQRGDVAVISTEPSSWIKYTLDQI